MTFYRGMLVPPSGAAPDLAGWLAGRTLLGILLLAALMVERRIPVSRDPGKEIAGVTLIVGAVAYLTSVFYFMLPRAPKIHPGAFVPASMGPAAGGDLRCRDGRLRLAVAAHHCGAGPGAFHRCGDSTSSATSP